LACGRSVERPAIPVAAWIMFLERQFRAGAGVVDPLATQLRTLALGNDPVQEILEMRQVFPEALRASSPFGAAVAAARRSMFGIGVRETLRA
jgi:fructuronate reductase